MRISHLITLSAATLAAAMAYAAPTISPDALRTYDKAVELAKNGDRDRASATVACLLMDKGVTIGLAAPGPFGESVSRSVRVWNDRLTGCPITYTTSDHPDVKVEFVDDISSGGDIQGEVRAQRETFWGQGGPGYKITGVILVRKTVRDRSLTHREVAAVVAHELGHLLGLDDDRQVGVLMGPFVPGQPLSGPTAEEVQAVSSFRKSLRSALATLETRPHSIGSRGVGTRGHRKRKPA